MNKRTENQINGMLRTIKRRRWYVALLVCLALAVTAGVAGVFHLPAIAKTYQVTELTCTAVPPEGAACADFFVHIHNDVDCFDAEGNLVCPLPEIRPHRHTADCYTTTRTLVCTTPESDGHQHTADCYTRVRGDLICELSTEPVLDEEGSVLEEGHVHTDECFAWTEELSCGLEEGQGAHRHDDSCYETTTTLTCDLPEILLHTHTDDCYQKNEDGSLYVDENGNTWLTCGQLQVLEHVHGPECFTTYELDDGEPELIFPEEEEQPAENNNQETQTGDDVLTNNSDTEPADENTSDDKKASEAGDADNTGDTAPNAKGEKQETASGEAAPIDEELHTVVYTGTRGAEKGGITVLAEIPDGALDENTQLILSDADENAARKQILKVVNEFAAEGEEREISSMLLLDIGFVSGGEPAVLNGLDPIRVTLRAAAIRGMSAPKLFHLSGVTAQEVKDVLFDTQAGSVVFTSASFSPFAVVDLTGEETAEEAVGVSMPAQDFHGATDGVEVFVSAPEGAFPAGTTMHVTTVPQEEVIGALNDAANGVMVRNVQAVDISFRNAEDEEIEPLLPISVKMSRVAKEQPAATEAAPEAKESVVLHVENDGSAQIVGNANVTDTEAEFESDSFSTYIMADFLTEEYIASNGHNYRISVTYGASAGIPENADLNVEELTEGSSSYETYVANTESALGMEEGSAGYIRLFDISIIDKHDPSVRYQPAEGTTVDVKIELADSENGELSVVHFANEDAEGDVVETSTEGRAVSFEAEGFSVYAIVGTDENAHQVRVKYVFQDAEGNPFLFLDEAGESVDNQIIKNGESLENVGLPELNADDQTFNGWYIYDTVNNNFTGYQITFDKPISISAGAETTSVTGDRVEISDADNTAVSNPANPDYTVYVRPSCGEVRYITFWNEVDGKIVYTKIQVPKGAQYNIASQSAIPPDAIVNDDGEVEYVSYAFEGWATEPGTLEKTGQPDTRTAVSDTVITVSEDCEFYPIFRLAHWISFKTAPVGSGATYYAPVYIRSGESASGARPATTPVWPGHTFVGWFEEEDDDYLSVGETASGAFNFNQTIDEDKILYAHWNAGTANVTVIRWLQSVTDDKNYTDAQKNYEYGGQENIIRDVNSVVYSSAFNDMTGFSVNSAKSDRSVIVKEDGTAVLNVYYDRKTIQMVFSGLGNQPGTYYTETTGNNGTQYGFVDGSYVELTRGTVPVTTWSYRSFVNAGDNSTNNVYGLVNGEYVPITRSNTRNVYDGEIYTGTRYNITNSNNTNPQQYGVSNGRVIPLYRHNTILGGHWSIYQNHSGFLCPSYNDDRYVINNNGEYGFGSSGMHQLDYSWTVNEDGSLYTGTRYVQATGNTSYDGNRYTRSGNGYTNYSYARTDSTTGTQYGVDVRGGHVQLTPTTTNQQVWYYTDMNGQIHIYEDTRFTKTTVNNTTVYTGLYGQTLEQNGYTWPKAPSGSWISGDTYMSYLGQFVLPDKDQTTIVFTTSGSGNKYFYYYLQNVDGTYPGSATDTGYGPSNIGTFNFTEKYDGFTFNSYQRGNDGNTSGGTWTAGSAGGSVSISGYNSIGIKYRRLSYDVKYLDSRNGTELSDVPSKKLVYGASLAGADPNVTDITPPTSQFVWDGHWYTDQDCTEIALFHDDLSRDGELGNYTSIDTENKTVTYGTGTNAKRYRYQVLGTMPNHDISVYAGWNEIWYWIKIDPDGGVLTDTESTWFWKTLGDKIEEYYDVTRRYVEDPNGSWYYHYDELDTETELNQYGTNERKAYYTLDPALSSDGGKTYSVDNKAYSLVGWYEVDQETGQLKGLYNFDGGVTGNTILRAVWRSVGEYTVKYSTEAVDASGNPLYADPDDEGSRIDTGEGTAPVDHSVYADKSNSAIARAPSSTLEDYVFMGWYYDGKSYGPGDAFMIKSELANADKEIWLYPVYVKYEDLPVTVTHIHWYANYNDRLGNQINDRTEDNQPSDYTTNDPLQLNVAVDIMDIDELLNGSTAYAGYQFLGWAKTQGANEPWLKLEEDGTYSMKDESKTVTGITMVAADEILPYDDMYAVWEPKPYTVTVIKSVNSTVSTDQQYPFVFTPYFSAAGLPADYQNNFSLTGVETTISTEGGDEITYYAQKSFQNIPYGSTFSFAEETYEDYELESVEYTVADADDTTKNTTNGSTANGARITVYGNVTVTFTNKPKQKLVKIYKIDDSETPVALEGVDFTLGEKRLTTGTDGYSEIVAMPVGEYDLTETTPKEHYIGLGARVTVTVGSTGVTIPAGTENVTVSKPDEDGVYTITVVNPREKYTVTVIKNVDGTDADKDAEYSFSATGLTDNTDSFTLHGRQKPETPSDDETLTQENKKVYEGIPYGTEFSIEETAKNDFDTTITATCKDSKGAERTIDLDPDRENKLFTGNLQVEGDLTVTYTNKRNNQPVSIWKTDLGHNTLTGASFALYKAEDYNDSTGKPKEHAVPIELPSGSAVGSNGILRLGNLAIGEYRLVETLAPAGYNLAASAIQITVESGRVMAMQSGNPAEVVTKGKEHWVTDQADDTWQIRVWNNPGVELPSTGGPGTALFTAIGGIMTALAGAILTLKKRKGHA